MTVKSSALSFWFFLLSFCFLSFKELYQPSAESLRQQEELKRLYQRQQEKGGIIDLEAERNRYFISLQQVRKGKGSPLGLNASSVLMNTMALGCASFCMGRLQIGNGWVERGLP